MSVTIGDEASAPASETRAIELAVPGSIANLGPGFDALSVAVQVYLRVRVLSLDPGHPDTIETVFHGAHPGGENRIERAFRLARVRFGIPTPGVRIEVRSDIPTRAGLGSSGAATVAGLRLYQELAGARDSGDILALASEVEGHPDNAAAALLGGLALSCQLDDGRVLARTWNWPAEVQLVVATPAVPLETERARAVLPASLTRADAVFNLQRALLLVHALDHGRYDDLREALRDRWHQPSRIPLVPGLTEALELEAPSILGVCLSGAGPSIVAFTAGQAPDVRIRLHDVFLRLGVESTVRVLSAHPPSS
jgi:homoserine kinase